MQSPTEPSWIAELANQERERRKEHQIVRIAAGEFRELLSEQIMSDLYTYLREFPQEQPYIQHTSETGASLITRLRDEDSNYDGVPCQVRFWIEVNQMVVECSFPHRPCMDRLFKIVLNSDGTLGLADASLADLSRYLLTPVLFDKLLLPDSVISTDPPNPSESQ